MTATDKLHKLVGIVEVFTLNKFSKVNRQRVQRSAIETATPLPRPHLLGCEPLRGRHELAAEELLLRWDRGSRVQPRLCTPIIEHCGG